ncbi:MAG: bifunctional glutamate--cysteine ligase GshA/glutathione synthetase GshB [Eubacteriaceae bacterium]|nr:bifunctional glutamate--cysteine ligase GshA/glutathione synthetase GshB [Eubacteriaceae bacterium]
MIKDMDKLELSTQMIIREALRRNINVEILDYDDNFIRLNKNGKIEYIKQATKTSADSYITSLIMENKEVTKLVLREHGIKVPDGISVHSKEEALEKYAELAGKDIVIKPKSTNFGKGVYIIKNLCAPEDYSKALDHAFEYDHTVLVEEFIDGREYRFLVIGDEVTAVLFREPANVTGDGTHSIEELVKEKNEDPQRGTGYVTPLEKIKLGEVEREYLKLQNKDSTFIPEKNQTIYLRENSNISTGGDSIDFTDEMLQSYKEIAVQSAKAVGAKITGADIIIKDIKAEPDPWNHGVIELNFNPALHIHDFPYKGKNREAEKKVLDLLGY